MPKIKRYTQDAFNRALEEIQIVTLTSYRASKFYNIPWQTLRDKIKKKYTKQTAAGAPTILAAAEEALLVKWCLQMAATGFPITKDLLLFSVAKLLKELKRDNKFKDGIPGRHWYEGFLRRNPVITTRVCQSLTSSRIKANEEQLRSWFQKVQSYFNDNDYSDVLEDPSRVFNCVESAFFLCPKGQPVLARKGIKTVYSRTGNDEKECLTLLLGATAAGQLMPVLCLFPYKRMPKTIVAKYPMNWSIGKTDSGWMTRESFYEYVTNVFNPFLIKENIKKPVVLFLDGHVSHLSLHLSSFCKENGIILVALLANSTHLLQPMDVAIFRGLKSEWAKQVYSWRMTNNGQRLKREDFPAVLEKAIKQSLTEKMIQNGFRKCGLQPFNENAIDYGSLVQSSEMGTPSQMICSTPLATPTSRRDFLTETHDHVQWFENCLEREKLKLFQECSKEWKGDVKDENLFYFWKKITSGGCQATPKSLCSTPMVLGDSTLEANINIDWPNDVDQINMVINEDNILEPYKEDETLLQNILADLESPDHKAVANEQSTYPTPFKKALIWPENDIGTTKIGKKKMIPSVATGAEFFEYQRRIDEEKKQ